MEGKRRLAKAANDLAAHMGEASDAICAGEQAVRRVRISPVECKNKARWESARRRGTWLDGIAPSSAKLSNALACRTLSWRQYGCLARVEWAREQVDRKSTRLNSSHSGESRMPSSA